MFVPVFLCAALLTISALTGTLPAQDSQSGGGALASYPVRGHVAISGAPVKVYKAPNTSSTVIGFLVAKTNYPLLIESSRWYGVNFHGAMGWVLSDKVSARRSAVPPSARAPQTASVPETSTTDQPTFSANDRNDSVHDLKSTNPDAGTQAPRESSRPRVTARSPRTPPSAPQQKKIPFHMRILRDMPALKIMTGDETDQDQQYSEEMLVGGESGLSHYVEVTRNLVPVYSHLAPDAPTLGIAQSGQRFVLKSEGTQWHLIQFADTTGWIERQYTKLISAEDTKSFFERIPFANLMVLLLLALLFLAIFGGGIWAIVQLFRRGAKRATEEQQQGKSCLIVARVPKKVEYAFSEKSTSLEKCFSEIGFKVSRATDAAIARNILVHYLPDVMCVDWEFARNAQREIEQLLSDRTSTANIFVLFYNVPDPARFRATEAIPNACYLGLSFTDRDIFKFVTPIIMTGSQSKVVRKSVESHALEGDLTDGSLSEVMQFIEIGTKSGCLLVDTDNKPFGMIYFEEGQITYAAAPDATGTDAVFSILNLTQGRFRFISNRRPPSRNVNIGTLGVLMEWTRLKDESTRG